MTHHQSIESYLISMTLNIFIGFLTINFQFYSTVIRYSLWSNFNFPVFAETVFVSKYVISIRINSFDCWEYIFCSVWVKFSLEVCFFLANLAFRQGSAYASTTDKCTMSSHDKQNTRKKIVKSFPNRLRQFWNFSCLWKWSFSYFRL